MKKCNNNVDSLTPLIVIVLHLAVLSIEILESGELQSLFFSTVLY